MRDVIFTHFSLSLPDIQKPPEYIYSMFLDPPLKEFLQNVGSFLHDGFEVSSLCAMKCGVLGPPVQSRPLSRKHSRALGPPSPRSLAVDDS